MGKHRMLRAKGCIVHLCGVHRSLAIVRIPSCKEDRQLPRRARFCETCGQVLQGFICVTFAAVGFASLIGRFLGTSIAQQRAGWERSKMRLLARVAVILILLGCGTAPMLYGKMAAVAGAGQAVSAPKFALIITNWSHRIKLSEPGLLLILGLGLVASAGRLPRFLNSRAYGKRRPMPSPEEQRNLKLLGKKPLSLKAVS
jgi:hypothetical protein